MKTLLDVAHSTPPKPTGFRVTIERRRRSDGKLEIHTFDRKTPNQAIARTSAQYKYGFLRLVSIEPLFGKDDAR